MELLHQVALQEHPQGGLARVVVREVEVDESETVQVEGVGRGDVFLQELLGGVVAGRCVVRQAFESHLLLGHQLARVLVHLGVVDTQAAEDGERLEQGDIAVGEGDVVLFVYQLGDTWKEEMEQAG